MENNVYITTVSKGKILIPKSIRQELNINDGDYILITMQEDHFSCRKITKDRLKMLLDTENVQK